MSAGTATRAPEDLGERYASALLDAESTPYEANGILRRALDAGVSPNALAVDVIPAALAEVGRRWAAGEVSVADEHLATETVRDALRELVTRLPRNRRSRGSVVVAAVDGELHDLGSRIVADLLAADGWEVLYVGAATPTDALAALVRDRRPDVVALSATLSAHLPALRAAVSRLRQRDMPRTFVLVGGQACAAEPHVADAVGADECALRADEAVDVLAGIGRQ